jgi:hypothetical protein
VSCAATGAAISNSGRKTARKEGKRRRLYIGPRDVVRGRMEDGGWRMEDRGWKMEDGVGTRHASSAVDRTS